MNRVPLYVINNFLTFDRKIYQLFGLQLGRPIRLKSIFYFFLFGAVELLWYFTPFLGGLLHWIPAGILLAIPVTLAWLVSDIGTENRSPISYFRSFISFHRRKLEQVTYYKGRKIEKPKTFAVQGSCTFKERRKTKSQFKSAVYSFKGYMTYK
ncbi:conjugal transfer protein [Domibacillus indicus]|uniref:TcpE family conjugal transfer membrane protein n=1 Tax=Domibacillus indicus TaxID=1437523 RepID=UPI00203DEAEC|nr:TcpE family conjugal transfer membrane protein [Domibacillus indicus]MCM3791269.1 conjugal transfer protein [Domibacillus indicus]